MESLYYFLTSKSDVSIAIYNNFKENNIEIPFPQQDVYIKNLPKEKEDL
jgi:small-conductance mechanosensitive channel